MDLSSRIFAIPLFLAVCLVSGHATARIDANTPASPETVARAIEVIVATHAQSPAPQQLALTAARSFLRHTGQPARLDLAPQAGKLKSNDEIIAFFKDLDSGRSPKLKPEPIWRNVLFEMAGSCGSHVVPARDAKVNESISSNRYVGTGIVLSLQDQYPTMAKVLEGGPAERAGAGDGDRIVSIDGEDTRDWNLRDSIDALRGPRGSKVEVGLLAPNASEDKVRDYTITRDVVPFGSIGKLQPLGGNGRGIGFVDIQSIRSSTVHELRKIERAAVEKNLRAMILDFRNLSAGRIHDTVLLANAFLNADDPIGRSRSARNTRDYLAEADRIFRDMPVAVLIDSSTSGPGEWLAAALDRNQAAVLVGMQTRGRPLAMTHFPVPDSGWVINIPHTLLEGPGGGPLVPTEKGSARKGKNPSMLRGPLPVARARRMPGENSVWPEVPVEPSQRTPKMVLPGKLSTTVPGKGENQLFLDAAIEALRKKLEG